MRKTQSYKLDERIAKTSVDQKQYVYVLLVRYPDRFSRFYRFLSQSKYSHASIGISDSDWTFFSFVLKGFRTELPRKHPTFKTKEIPCELYRVEVSTEKYIQAKAILEEHVKRSHHYKFSYLGLLFCYMRIKLHLKDRYFCSHFVSEVLDQIQAVPLTKQSSFYLPDDFMSMSGLELYYTGNLSRLVNPQATALSYA
ncbi:MAG: hypothetical protein LBU61_00570 [Coriobacteriales bacterium]|nr:hypothetical protein [Coriobacteriales bacterium]